MSTKRYTLQVGTLAATVALSFVFSSERMAAKPTPGFNNKIPENIMTPDSVETRIGTMEFFDGMPTG